MSTYRNCGVPAYLTIVYLLSTFCVCSVNPAQASGQSPSRITDAQFARSLGYMDGRAKQDGGEDLHIPTTSDPIRQDKAVKPPPSFKKVMIIVLENISYSAAMSQDFLAGFAGKGALLANFSAETHPSQGNYIALTAGTVAGVASDKPYNLKIRHLGDLLEAKGKTWKVYAQGYPGHCFLGERSGNYVRKHVPFLSYLDVQQDPGRCAAIVDDSGFSSDISGGKLPDFSLFIPDIKNDGHDTGVDYSGKWLNSYFAPLMKNPDFMKDMLLVITFDEDDNSTATNHIYTALYGDSVVGGSVSKGSYTHYSLLRTIEDTLGLGTLGQNDLSASPVTGIWR